MFNSNCFFKDHKCLGSFQNRETFPAFGPFEVSESTYVSDKFATLILGLYPVDKAVKVKSQDVASTSKKIRVTIIDPSDLYWSILGDDI